jgi:hypothetical protein
VSGVELEDEDIVHLVQIPKFAVNAEKQHQKEHEKVSSIYLEFH